MPAVSTAPDLESLLDLLRGRRIVVLAGAGCSTESGIPDYRGPDARPRAPVQFQDFIRTETARVRYWARSAGGWARFSSARPNDAHRALARLEEGGVVRGIITQNVDGLHEAAGSRNVVELHGSLSSVRCMGCGAVGPRDDFQRRLLAANRIWAGEMAVRAESGEVRSAPDGDADLPAALLDAFRVPACERCGGVIKPDVVFFGENVPAERVEQAWRLYGEGEVLLVAGSSLTVYSGRRFIYRAQQAGMPIAIVNIGPTRADEMAAAKVEGRLGNVLPRLADALVGRSD